MLTIFSLLIWIALGYGAISGGLALNAVRRRRLGWLSKDELRSLEAHAARLQGPLARALEARRSIFGRGDRRLRLLVDRGLRALSEQELARRQIRELLAKHSQRDLDDGAPMKRQEELESLRRRAAELEAGSAQILAQLESLQIGLLAETSAPDIETTLDELELASSYWRARGELGTGRDPDRPSSS